MWLHQNAMPSSLFEMIRIAVMKAIVGTYFDTNTWSPEDARKHVIFAVLRIELARVQVTSPTSANGPAKSVERRRSTSMRRLLSVLLHGGLVSGQS